MAAPNFGRDPFDTLVSDLGDPTLRTYNYGGTTVVADPINGEIFRNDVLGMYAWARTAANATNVDLTLESDAASWVLNCMSEAMWEPFRLNRHIIQPLDLLVVHGEGVVITLDGEDQAPLDITPDKALIGKLAGIYCLQYSPLEPIAADSSSPEKKKCGAMLALCDAVVLCVEGTDNEVKDMPEGAFVPVGEKDLTIAQAYAYSGNR